MPKSKATRGRALPPGKAGPDVKSLSAKLDGLMKRIPKGTFRAGGAQLGSMYGPAGATLGAALGSGISRITGYGDYKVENNSIMTSGSSYEKDDVPAFGNSAKPVKICHREFVSNIVVPTDPGAFTNGTFTINPGNVNLFPWLSAAAKQYQQYSIRGMVVEFKSLTSDYSAAGPLGQVGIATNYNTNDQVFADIQQFQNSQFAVVTRASRSIMHPIECDPAQRSAKWMYVRDPNSADQGDNFWHDFGRLQVMTEGLPGTPGDVLGQLWITYDIDFIKPIVPYPVAAPGGSYAAFTSQSDGTLLANVDARLQKMFMTNPIKTVTASSVVSVFDPTATSSAMTGDTGIWGTAIADGGTVVEDGASRHFIKLLEPGHYDLMFRVYGVTTASLVAMASATDQSDTPVYQPRVDGGVVGEYTYYFPPWTPVHRSQAIDGDLVSTSWRVELDIASTTVFNPILVALPRFITNSNPVSLVSDLTMTMDAHWSSRTVIA